MLLLKSLPSSIQLSLHLDKNVRGCALLLLYFLSDLCQLKLCLTAQHSPSYEPSFPYVLVHISADYFPSRFKYRICDCLLNTIADLHLHAMLQFYYMLPTARSSNSIPDVSVCLNTASINVQNLSVLTFNS